MSDPVFVVVFHTPEGQPTMVGSPESEVVAFEHRVNAAPTRRCWTAETSDWWSCARWTRWRQRSRSAAPADT
jgi:hypothetical protein